jgi:hypothetical protein
VAGAVQQTGPRLAAMGGKHRPGNGEAGRGRAAVPDASLAGVEAGKLAAVSAVGVSPHHMQGDVPLLGCPGDLGSAVPAVGRHPVAHGLGEAGQRPAARVAHFARHRAPPAGHQGQIAAGVVGVASRDRILRTPAGTVPG